MKLPDNQQRFQETSGSGQDHDCIQNLHAINERNTAFGVSVQA